MTKVVGSVALAVTAAVASGQQPASESSTVGPQVRVIDATAECRAKFPGYLRDFGVNPFSTEGHEDPRPIGTDAPKALVENILDATRAWVVQEGFDRCVSAVCACVLEVPGRGYAAYVADCERTPGVLDHRVAIVYFSKPDLERIDVVKWFTRCAEPSVPAPSAREAIASTIGRGSID